MNVYRVSYFSKRAEHHINVLADSPGTASAWVHSVIVGEDAEAEVKSVTMLVENVRKVVQGAHEVEPKTIVAPRSEAAEEVPAKTVPIRKHR